MGLRIRGLLIGLLQLPPPEGLLGLGEIAHHILPLVPLAALDDRLGSKDLLDGLMEALGPVDDAEKTGVDSQPALQQGLEEVRGNSFVLRPALDETQDDLLAREGDLQGDDHLVLGEGLPIQQEGDKVIGFQPTLAELLELPGTGPEEAPGNGRGAQAEDRGDRLGALSIGSAAQAPQDLEEQLPIGLMGLLQLLVGAEGDLFYLSIRPYFSDRIKLRTYP